MKQTKTVNDTSVNNNHGDLPVKSERNFWLIRVEMMSSDTSNGLHMRIVIMKNFFIQFHSVGHVIQLLDTIKKTKRESWNVLQCFRNIPITFYRLTFWNKQKHSLPNRAGAVCIMFHAITQIIRLAPWAGKRNQILRCDWLSKRERRHFRARSGLPLCPSRKIIPYNKSLIDQACLVKMAEYWPRSPSRFTDKQKKKN